MMIINGSRGSGKTVEAIKLAATTGAVIVCRNKICQKLIIKSAEEMGLNINHPVVYTEIDARYNFPSQTQFIIDDVDDYFFRNNRNIIAITATSSNLMNLGLPYRYGQGQKVDKLRMLKVAIDICDLFNAVPDFTVNEEGVSNLMNKTGHTDHQIKEALNHCRGWSEDDITREILKTLEGI